MQWQPRETFSIRVDRDVPVTMRDGTVLMTDVYRPAAEGRYPVLLQRTPYNKETGGLSLVQTDTFRAVRQGYAVVIQDCRGRYRSDGDFNPFLQEIADGYDAVEWCGSQPWSDGNVGMYGTSYVGATQWLAAIAAPPSLRAIAPAFTASDYYEGWTYQGGAFEWGFMCNWVLPFLTTGDLLRTNARQGVPDFDEWRQRLITAIDNLPETAKTLPLTDIPVNPAWTPYFAEWMAHPSRDEFWQERSIEDRHDQVRVPALNIAGWYDIFLDGSLRNFTGVQESGATEEAREGSRLLLGPWTHTTPPLSKSGSVDFGAHGRAEPDAAQPRRRRGDAALLRLLAEGDRRRALRRAAGAPLRHGRGRLALRERVAAGAGGRDRVLPEQRRQRQLDRGRRHARPRSAGRRPAGYLPLRPLPPRADRRRAALLLPGDTATPAPSISARSKRGPTSSSTRRLRWRRTPR